MLAAVIAKLLGVGQESEAEEQYRSLRAAATKAGLIPRFSHLETHYVKDEKELSYPENKYYVVNTRTKKAYWVPQYISDLDTGGVIQSAEHQTARQLKKYLKKNEITLFNTYPKGNELSFTQAKKDT